MADAKIINYGQQINAGSTAIPDNNASALDIESTDAAEYIKIDTTNSNEKLILGDGMAATGAVCIGTDDNKLNTTLQQLTVGHPDGSSKTRVHIKGVNSGSALTMNAGAATQNAEINLMDGETQSRWTIAKSGNGGSGVGNFNIQGSTGASGAGTTLKSEYESGKWCLTTDGTGPSSVTHNFQVQDGDIGVVTNNASDATAKSLVFTRSRSGTDGTAVVVQDNDILGNIEFQGAEDGDSYATGAKIFARVRGTPGDGDMPCELVFAMSKDNSETPVETLRIMPTATANKAQVTIGTDSYASAYTYSPIAVDAETQNGPVFERTNNGNAMVFQFNTKNCISGSSHPISLMPGGTERLLIGTDGTVTATSGLLSSVGAISTALTSGTVASPSPGSGTSTTLNGSSTVFHDDFHVGAAIKVGTVVTTVTAIANATSLTLEDAIDTGVTGTTCTRDGGELFAVKTGDNKTLFSVTGTGAIQAGSAAADSDANNNLAIGDADALNNINQMSLGERNYIIGHSSGQYSISTGQRNCFMGYAAGEDINSGFDNVLLGAYAGSAGTSMQGATHLGYSAGASATGNDTVFIGREAGLDSTGNYNTSVGSYSLASEGSATSASYITALGYKTLTKNAGGYNTAVGAHALEDVIAGGTHNTAVGFTTGNDITDNTNMVLLGSGAQPSANTGVTNEIVIGKSAAGQGSHSIMLGNSSITGLHCYDTSISSPSDSRIKDNVQDSGLGLDFINALRPVKYQKKHPSEFPEEIREKCWADQEVVRTRPTLDPDTGEEGTEEYTETIPADTKPDDWQARTEYGLIAQEVKAAMVAHGAEDWQGHKVLPSGMEALSYGNLVTVLVKSVQELSARVAELEEN